MSDDELRELERRYKESGDRTDWVRWLAARVRAGALSAEALPLVARIESGSLTRERIQLAAYLGDRVAQELDEHETIALATQLGDLATVRVVFAEPEAVSLDDLLVWQQGLAHWGQQVVVLALCACAQYAASTHTMSSPADDPAGAVQSEAWKLLHPTLAWVRCPCAEHAQGVQEALDQALVGLWSYAPVLAASQAAQAAVRAQAGQDVSQELDKRLLYRPAESVTALRAGLIPWALGSGA